MLKLLTDEELCIDKNTRYKLDNHLNVSGQLPMLGGIVFPVGNDKGYYRYQELGFSIMDVERIKRAEF